MRIAKICGEYVWHTHTDTDEFFLLRDGRLTIALRDADGERSVSLARGAVFVVPRASEHKPRPGSARASGRPGRPVRHGRTTR